MNDQQELLIRLVEAVQAAMVAETARRTDAGESAMVTRNQQEAFVGKVLAKEFQRIDTRRTAEGVGRLSQADEEDLIDRVVAETVGLGAGELLLADPEVEDVMVPRHDLIFQLRSDGSVRQVFDKPWRDEKALSAWISHLARTAGRTERQFNAQNPMLVMRIGDGLRLAATRDVSQHVSFSLRRNTMGKSADLGELVGRGMMPDVIADLARAWMRSNEVKVVVVGATGAGKTTFVRACLAELQPFVRVVVVEDTAEIDLFDESLHPNVESWEERLPNSEGEGGVSMGHEIKHGLRYRPDWLIVGEVRDANAAVPMLKAMTHGQASMTTVHAHTALAGLDKLAVYLGTGEDKLPIEVAHHQLSQAVDFVVHIDRGVKGKRFVSEVIEVAGFDEGRATTNTIYTAVAPGEGQTMQRLTPVHRGMLEAAGFDSDRLGSGWR